MGDVTHPPSCSSPSPSPSLFPSPFSVPHPLPSTRVGSQVLVEGMELMIQHEQETRKTNNLTVGAHNHGTGTPQGQANIAPTPPTLQGA